MKKILQFILSLGIGAVLGVILLWVIGFDNMDKMEFWQFFMAYTFMFFGVYAILIFTTIIH